jgi:uncharacterized protein GlcG (DUF336 family)
MTATTQQATQAISQAMAKAAFIGVAANIVVLDTAGYLKSFQRMDNAYLGSIDIALGKAKTAMLFRMNSEEVGTFLDPVQKTFGMEATNGGLVGFKGGMPIRKGNEILAYIGVSGGSPDQDFEIAMAGSALG